LFASIASAWLVFVAGQAHGAPGDLDPTFGTDGWAAVSLDAYGTPVSEAVFQPDGRIVVAGLLGGDTFAAWRHLSNGALDAGFDGDGTTSVTFPGHFSGALAVALQPDGNIVLAGYARSNRFSHSAMAVARLLPGGVLDSSFGGGDGKARIRIEGMTVLSAEAVEVLGDRRILLGGPVSGRSYGGLVGTALVMLTPAGDLDAEFGAGGVVLEDGAFDAFTVDAGGNILVAMGGDSHSYPHATAFQVGRFSSDGTRDSTFGADGVRSYSRGSPTDVLVDEAGRILLSIEAGSAQCPFEASYVARLTPDGDWDSSFADDGKTPRRCIFSPSLAVQADERVVVVGSVFAGAGGGENVPVIGRLNVDGSIDATFGYRSAVIAEEEWMNARDVLIQPDGKIVLVAHSSYGPVYALARFLSV
jgi:uncharacterized delta-60 repeat protein